VEKKREKVSSSVPEHLQNGRYAVLKKLGEGGKGVVYKARDTVLNRVVAIKMLKTGVTEGEGYSRFLTEAQAVGKLNHPNVVSIHDIGKEDSKQFFVLEFVDGESLRDLMETYPEGKCDIQVALRIGMDVCNALQYAHSHEVLHRDIKPENVMITKDGTAKLMDFGLAKILNRPRITQEGIIVGTVAYVAPENALGKGADARSDLYSFGAVLYEALTGRPPFPGEDPVKVIFGHVHDYPIPVSRLNPKVPPALADCVMRLLEKDPEKRYQTAADLLGELREIAGEFAGKISAPSVKPPAGVTVYRQAVTREAPLIDRAEEMNSIREAVDRTLCGEGGLVFISGEAGIGKTRLTREASAYAHLRGVKVLDGRYTALFSAESVPPFVLWSEVIKGYVVTSAPEQVWRVIGLYPAEICKLVPEVKQKLVAVPQSVPISPEHERHRLFEAVSQFVNNISNENPLLVILDDLQWADQSSLLLLHYLAQGIHDEPLLILCAYRDGDIDEKHPLSPILTELNRERLPQTISLKRLSFVEIMDMIKQTLEQEDVSEEFCQLVYEKTRGNPFFVEEVVKSLKEDQIIYREENKWKIKSVSSIEFPKSVKSVVRSRIQKLDDECQNVLVTASVIGERFTFEALREVSGIDENKLYEVMEKILKTGLIKENVILGEDVYSFVDIIVRDVLHEEVSHLRRKRLHSAVGFALEKVYSKKIEQHFGELARHFLEGGDESKAFDYFFKAGEKAEKMYAHDEAFSYFNHALELIRNEEDAVQQEADLTEKLGDIKGWIGESDACIEYWNRSLRLWDQLNDRKSISRLNGKMAHMLWETVGNKEEASRRHQMALEILEKEPETVELAILYEDLSRMLWRSGKHAESLPWAQKAFAIAQKSGDAEVLARCYASLGALSLFEGEYDRASQYLEQGVKIAVDNNCVASLRLYQNLGNVYFAKGDFQRSFETCQRAFELAKKVGDILWTAMNGYLLASIYVFMGEMQKAVALYEEALVLDKKAKNSTHIATIMTGLGQCYCLMGEWDRSLQFLNEGLELSQKIGDYQVSGIANKWLGELYVDMENFAQAERYLDEANSIFERAGDKTGQLCEVYPTLSRIYLTRGEVGRARELIEKAYEYAVKTESKSDIADGEMLKGLLFREDKNWEQAIVHFENGLQRYESMDAQKWYVHKFARLLYEYGLTYLARNEERDRERAYVLLNRSLELHKRIDAKKRIEEIIAKKKLLTA
jgi:tetratricopeptide (TPR) repeat protein/tRNA A-37 threonylcarbamoyl transferase component Bud32